MMKWILCVLACAFATLNTTALKLKTRQEQLSALKQEEGCESLPFWKEYEALGVVMNKFPDVNKVSTGTIEIRMDRVDLAELTEFVGALGKDVQAVNVWALEVTVDAQKLKYYDSMHRHELDSPCKDHPIVGIKNTLYVPTSEIPVNVFASRWVSPWTKAEEEEYQARCDKMDLTGRLPIATTKAGEEFYMDEVKGNSCWFTNFCGVHLVKDYAGGAGYFLDIVEAENVRNVSRDCMFDSGVLNLRTGQLADSEENALNKESLSELTSRSIDTIGYFLQFACAMNLASVGQEQSELATRIAAQLATRLGVVSAKFQSASVTDLALNAGKLAAKLISTSITPADILVPKWSTNMLENRFRKSSEFSLQFAQKVETGLQPNTADEVRLGQLEDLGKLVTSATDMAFFQVEQALNTVGSFRASITKLEAELQKENTEAAKANQEFKDGIADYVTAKSRTAVFSFFSSIFEIMAGAFTGDFSSVVEGVEDLIGSTVELGKLQEEFQKIQDLQNELASLMSSATTAGLPSTNDDLAIYIARKSKDGTSEELLDPSVREALLKMSHFDRASADAILLNYDTVLNTIDNILQTAVEKKISGATGLVLAYKRMCVAGKAVTNSKIGYAAALNDYARNIYQAISNKRSGSAMSNTAEELRKKQLATHEGYVANVLPTLLSMQTKILNQFLDLCNAYMYLEGVEVSCLRPSLEPYSVRKFDLFLQAVDTFILDLEDATPMSRQAFSLIGNPVVISSSNPQQREQLELFRRTKSLIIPQGALYNAVPIFSHFYSTCLLSTSVEAVGAVAKDPTKDTVIFQVRTIGAPVLQRTAKKTWMHFKTPAMDVLSAYSISTFNSNNPSWSIEGMLWDSDSRFCRTPYQDMVLHALDENDDIDWSKVSELRIYMSGHGNTFPTAGSSLRGDSEEPKVLTIL